MQFPFPTLNSLFTGALFLASGFLTLLFWRKSREKLPFVLLQILCGLWCFSAAAYLQAPRPGPLASILLYAFSLFAAAALWHFAYTLTGAPGGRALVRWTPYGLAAAASGILIGLRITEPVSPAIVILFCGVLAGPTILRLRRSLSPAESMNRLEAVIVTAAAVSVYPLGLTLLLKTGGMLAEPYGLYWLELPFLAFLFIANRHRHPASTAPEERPAPAPEEGMFSVASVMQTVLSAYPRKVLFQEFARALDARFGINRFSVLAFRKERSALDPLYGCDEYRDFDFYRLLPSGGTFLEWSANQSGILTSAALLASADANANEAGRLLNEGGVSSFFHFNVSGESAYSFLLGSGSAGSGPPHSSGDPLECYLHMSALLLELENLGGQREQLLAQVKAAERLASVGTLAAGLAHEIRNPLVSVKTFIQLLPERLHDEEFRTQFLEIVDGEVQRICRLVDNLLDFAKPSKPSFKCENINEIAESMLSLLQSRIREKGIHILQKLSPEIPSTLVDKERVKQVFLNILLNAIQASSLMGKIYVQTSLVCPTGDTSGHRFIQILVRDEGPGIPEHMLERVFDPFFTTKPDGSGLGMAIANQIVLEHQGFIDVESSVGKGSTFFVNLPVRTAERTE
jgi:signal transduction histidine kinase